jgi:L-ascorbate metabolism protein UlaG (beta-lactamase superfamily)
MSDPKPGSAVESDGEDEPSGEVEDSGNEVESTPNPRRRRWLRRLGYVAAGIVAVACFFAVAGWTAFGRAAEGSRLERMHASKQWAGNSFDNPLPLFNDVWLSIRSSVSGSAVASPSVALPVVRPDPSLFQSSPAGGLRITWLGHSTTLIEIDGRRILTDPVWGERTSPFSFMGPKRWYAPPIALDDLPAIDVVLLSHDHYDHLDAPTIQRMVAWESRFIAPLGVGAHLEYWGVPAARITEVDWWDRVSIDELTIHCTPARHASGRHLFDQNATLWAGYALVGPAHRVFFSGDTGMFPELSDIGARFGPFDVTMIEVGAYHQAWPDWHMGPEQAVTAHRMLRGKAFLPIHWGLFDLALHGWTEPVERTSVAAEKAGVDLLLPKPGESIVPGQTRTARWWPEVSWQTAEEHAIVATAVDHAAIQTSLASP